MNKKVIKKKKLKIFNFLIFIVVVLLISFFIKILLNVRIRNIYISGNKYLNDDYIIKKASLYYYPKFITYNIFYYQDVLKKDPYIKDVSIRRGFFSIKINIVEKRAVLFNGVSNEYSFNDNTKIKESDSVVKFVLPRLLNFVPNNIYRELINSLSKINDNILNKISDIEYSPNNIDKERFILYMNDGNLVYITLTKFNKISYYDNIYSQLDNHKGILYLDNGNHFEIKE